MTEEEQKIINDLESSTGLRFVENPVDGNLCFKDNNQDLRDEFKEIFNLNDFRDYQKFFENRELIMPKDNLEFWSVINLVRKQN